MKIISMRRLSLLPVVILSSLLFIFIIISSCGSKSVDPTPTPTPTPTTEVTLAVTTNPSVGSNVAPAAIANGQPLTVTVTSALPAGGVKIEVTAKLETGMTDFFTGGDAKSTVSANNYTITNVPAGGAACVCTVKVTSLTTATNIFTGSFRFARK